jgi:hypothetical protein
LSWCGGAGSVIVVEFYVDFLPGSATRYLKREKLDNGDWAVVLRRNNAQRWLLLSVVSLGVGLSTCGGRGLDHVMEMAISYRAAPGATWRASSPVVILCLFLFD